MYKYMHIYIHMHKYYLWWLQQTSSVFTHWPECIHCECQLSAIIPCSQGWHTSVVPGPPSLPERNLGNKWTDSVGNPGRLLLTRSGVNSWSPSSVPPQTPFELLFRSEAAGRVCVLTGLGSHHLLVLALVTPALPHPSRHRMCRNICSRGATLTQTVWRWNLFKQII